MKTMGTPTTQLVSNNNNEQNLETLNTDSYNDQFLII